MRAITMLSVAYRTYIYPFEKHWTDAVLKRLGVSPTQAATQAQLLQQHAQQQASVQQQQMQQQQQQQQFAAQQQAQAQAQAFVQQPQMNSALPQATQTQIEAFLRSQAAGQQTPKPLPPVNARQQPVAGPSNSQAQQPRQIAPQPTAGALPSGFGDEEQIVREEFSKILQARGG